MLVSMRKRQLKPLVEAVLSNELRLLEAGIRRTEQRILLILSNSNKMKHSITRAVNHLEE